LLREIALVKLTKGHLPQTVVQQADNYGYGRGTLVLHLALPRLPDWKKENPPERRVSIE
jgi:hypothetical protein